MNLLLLLCLLQAWVVFTDKRSAIFEEIDSLQMQLRVMQPAERSKAVADFITLVVGSDYGMHADPSKTRKVDLARLVALTPEEVMASPYFAPKRSAAEIIIAGDTDDGSDEHYRAAAAAVTHLKNIHRLISNAALANDATVADVERAGMNEIQV